MKLLVFVGILAIVAWLFQKHIINVKKVAIDDIEKQWAMRVWQRYFVSGRRMKRYLRRRGFDISIYLN